MELTRKETGGAVQWRFGPRSVPGRLAAGFRGPGGEVGAAWRRGERRLAAGDSVDASGGARWKEARVSSANFGGGTYS